MKNTTCRFQLTAVRIILVVILITPIAGCSDGTFTLGTYTPDDGELPGKHRVAVFSHYSIGTCAERLGLNPETKLPERYRRLDTSGITIDVAPCDNQIIIEVESVAKDDCYVNQTGKLSIPRETRAEYCHRPQ